MIFYKCNLEINKTYNSIFNPAYIKYMDKMCLKNLFNNKGLIKTELNKYKAYLLYRYTDEIDIEIVIKRIRYNIEFAPICPTCKINKLKFIGKPSKLYTSHCSCKCSARDKSTTKKKQETQLKNWGTFHCYDSSLYQLKLKEKYGFEYWWQKETTKNKRKESMLSKYGTLNPYNNTEIRDTINKTNIERYGCENPMQNEEVRKKYNTSRKNNYNKLSKNEQKIKEMLIDLYGNDLICQYSSEKYPFNCDFYISSLNLYIEYHGSHFHQYHPFDKNNNEDIKTLEKLKEKANKKKKHPNQYDMIIYTWTDLDVRKREIAEKNKLNFITYYKMPTIEEIKIDIEKYKKVID